MCCVTAHSYAAIYRESVKTLTSTLKLTVIVSFTFDILITFFKYTDEEIKLVHFQINLNMIHEKSTQSIVFLDTVSVSLYKGISTFVGYLDPKPSL